ncbi:MAG: electron transport complex subunit RsxG [Agarilytica sp.]
MLAQSVGKNSFILAAFAIVTAGLLAFTFLGTKDKIAAAERRAAQKALTEIISLDRHNNDMLEDTWNIPAELLEALGLNEEAQIHIARQDERVIAMVIPSIAPDGYSGDIKLIIGINADETLAGVRVLAHKETPGLGDKVDINKDDWILNFNEKSLNTPAAEHWKVKKDGGEFDQFTGATITPRAVVKRVKQTLEFYSQHKNDILETETLEQTEQ